MEIDLRGKSAIVTGVGRGIGREIAATLAREGVRLTGTDLDAQTLAEFQDEMRAEGHDVTTAVCNVLDSARIGEVVAEAEARTGRIDIVVNNAGVFVGGSLSDMTEEAWDLNHDVNLKGVFLMCKAVTPAMKRQRYGRIINAASFAAIVPSIGGGAYASSKAGCHFYTRALAGELGPYNITVNCYAPGMIPTEMNHFADAPDAAQERMLDTLTLRRWGEPKEVANLVCFLASDLAEYITGALIDVSGGKLATQMPQVGYEWARG